jgi:hypothetical protein
VQVGRRRNTASRSSPTKTYDPKDADMTRAADQDQGQDGVQAILNPGFGQGPSIVTRNYKQLAIDLPLYQSHGVASDGFIELAGRRGRRRRAPAGHGASGRRSAAG